MKGYNLLEILQRLKLKYKIDKGTVYAAIETTQYSSPTLRPAFNEEITQAKERERLQMIFNILKHYSKQEPVHAPRPAQSPFNPSKPIKKP